MKYIRVILTFLILFVGINPLFSQGPTYINEQLGVSLNLPGDWFMKSGEDRRRLADANLQNSSFPGKTKEGLNRAIMGYLPLIKVYKDDPQVTHPIKNPNIYLAVKEGKSLNDTRETLEMAKILSNCKVPEPIHETSHKGLPTLTTRMECRKKGEVILSESYYYVFKSGHRYGLFLQCLAEDFSLYQSTYQSVIDSLEID